jgi:arylsulfatase
MFDNTNFPWAGDLSTEIDTIGDLLRKQNYYTAYKGKWHLTEKFETANKLHAPKELLSEEMEAYGFSDYFGIGDVIGHTEGGYLHDHVISSMTRSWMRGKGQQLRAEGKPWFMAVNLINPHDVMFYNTDLHGQKEQSAFTMFRLNRDPESALYQQQWDVGLSDSRHQPFDEKGRPGAHLEFRNSRGVLVGTVPDHDANWQRQNNYYLNCLKDVDNNIVQILDELESLGIADKTIVIFTSDHGELGGAHGLSGKGATAYREQNNVPFMMIHPSYSGNKRCKAVTSHVDIATTLISLAGGNPDAAKGLPGKDISILLENPEAASVDALRDGALYNFNMLAFVDQDFLGGIGKFLAEGGSPKEIAGLGLKPNLEKRGAIRCIYDGQYKLVRYFSPLQHHVPKTMEELFAHNDIELFDLASDPREVKNLALDVGKYGEIIAMMNDKLNLLIANEVGDDDGQMLPSMDGVDWRLSSSIRSMSL